MYPPDFWEEVAQQLVKDFGGKLAHWDISSFSNEKALALALQPELHVLLIKSPTALRNIIYRVDIPENRLGKLIAGKGKEETAQLLATAFVQRAMEKVHFRKSFGKGRLS